MNLVLLHDCIMTETHHAGPAISDELYRTARRGSLIGTGGGAVEGDAVNAVEAAGLTPSGDYVGSLSKKRRDR